MMKKNKLTTAQLAESFNQKNFTFKNIKRLGKGITKYDRIDNAVRTVKNIKGRVTKIKLLTSDTRYRASKRARKFFKEYHHNAPIKKPLKANGEQWQFKSR